MLDVFIGVCFAVYVVWKLDSIEKHLKDVLVELRKTSQPPLTEEEAELERRRAAIREVQENWPTYK